MSVIEDILPLTPLQEGLLFHTLRDPEGIDVYTGQLVVSLRGEVDPGSWRAAGQTLLDRHANLRLAFRQRRTGESVALVARSVPLPWAEVNTDPASITRLLEADLRTRFDPATPPLIRMTLYRLGPAEYRLAITHHHLLLDGWSMPVLLRELIALVSGVRLPAPPDHRAYHSWLAGQDRPAARAAWTDALAGLADPTLINPRSAAGSALAEVGVHELPSEETIALARFARGAGLTLNTVVQGAWGLLLAGLTGRDDVVFGMTVAGRPPELPDAGSMIGLFINTVPVRVRLDPAEPVTDLLRRLQVEQAELMAHQHLGLAEIQRRSPVSGDLFDTLTVFENYPLDSNAGATVGSVEVTGVSIQDADHYPLSLTARPGERLRLELQYAQTLDGPMLLTRLAAVLRQFSGGGPTGRITLLSDAERALTLGAWAGDVPHRRPGVLPELPVSSATALVTSAGSWSFGDLDAWSNRFARYLADAGAGPGSVVALALPRALMVPAILGTLKTGAAYLPLDENLPPERVSFMLEDARPVVVIDRVDDAELEWFSSSPFSAAVSPDSAAYVIYTSGSTGRPKGVVVPHRGLANLFATHRSRLMPPSGSRPVGHVASFVFDGSWEPLLWMFAGNPLHVLDADTYRDADAVVSYVRSAGLAVLDVTPTYARELIGAGLLDAGLEVLLLGGEATDDALWREVCAVPGLVVHDLYGPTEASVDAYGWHGSALGERTAYRLDGYQVYVLDSALRPTLPGVAGELYLAGAGLAHGYLNRPGLTAERFVASVFGGPGERMYRTGDLARWSAVGVLEFAGRVDGQVKLRGFRIELGEVEAAVLALPGVWQAAVVVREDAPGAHRLVGYVVAESQPEVRQLDRSLPEYMVPAALVVLDALPRTVNGKLDVAALPAPDLRPAQPHRPARRGPQNEAEESLAQLFAEVLGLPSVGVDDDFFALGGHSLLVMRLVSRVRASLGTQIGVRAVFDAPTVAALAPLVGGEPAPSRPALVASPRPARVPLSFAQQRLWFLHQLEGASANYNIPMAWRVTGPLEVAALDAAVGDLVTRHESLRTLIVEHGVEAWQRVLPAPVERPLLVVHPAGPGLADRLAAQARLAFDLAAEIPIRLSVFADSTDDPTDEQAEHVVLLLVHHIAADEWSDLPLARDLAVAYAARVAGEAPEFSALPVQYADYTLWQNTLLGRPDDPTSLIAGQETYWREALSGLPEELPLPMDRPRPRARTVDGGTVDFTLEPSVTRRLRDLATGSGASMFMLVHAAVAALMTRVGAGTDVPLGTPIAGRTDAALNDLVGFFLNTLVLRTDTSGNPTFAELLTRVREVDLAAYEHQDVPFERLVEVLNPERSTARHPLFQVMVVYLASSTDLTDSTDSTDSTAAGAAPTLPGLTTVPEPVARATSKFDLSFDFADTADVLGGSIEYSADVFDRASVEALAARLVRLLTAVAADPATRLAAIDVLSPAERRQVLGEWSAGPSAPVPVSLVGVFQEQTRCTPSAPALVAGREWSFAELDDWANRFARYLADAGAGPGSVVALGVPRALMVPAVLGVLKSGAAYLPLDENLPPERVSFMLDDTRPVVVVDRVDDADLAGYSTSPLSVVVSPDSAAYVIYTSGSTGRPKGVVVPHRGLANLFATHRAHLMPTSGVVRVGHVASFAFDGSWEPLLWMFAGHPLHVLDADTYRDADAVVAYVRDAGLGLLDVTPTYARELIGAGLLSSGLGVLLVGGEATDDVLWRELCAVPGLVVRDLYGPTEASVDAYGWDASPAGERVAYRLAGVGVYVLDPALQPVPAGVVGEVYVAGAGLAHGYLNRPGLTAERFVASVFGGPGERMYRTGDLARWSAVGVLEFAGRVDGQVKLRGFRIELGEVEAAVLALPGVWQAAVVVQEERLVGYVVAARELDLGAARAELAATLPPYLVPAALVALESIPRTVNGKLDTRALPAPDRATLRPGGRAPRTETERVVAGLLADVLGLPEVGADEDFFALGGHSLLVMRLIGRLRSAFETRLGVRAVFDAPTVAGLAALLDEEAAPDQATTRPPLIAVERPERVPLSFAQQRLWFLHQLEGPSATYNIPMTWRLTGELDRSALEQALTDVVARHEALRTVLADDGDGSAYQKILDPPTIMVEFGRTGEPGLADAIGHRFAIDREIPFRAWVFETGRRKSTLLVLVHHVAADEWSDTALTRDLADAYRARREGRRPGFDSRAFDYADYALWQRRLLGDEADPASLAAQQIDFWRTRLAGAPAELDLPLDRPRPEAATYRGGSVEFRLPAELTDALRKLAAANGVSMFMVTHAAVATLLTRLGAGPDLPLGTPVAGRSDEGLDDLVGFFVNTVVLRTDTSGDPTFAELLARVREIDLAAFEHQDVPFERLVDVLNPERSLARHPLFQVMVSYLTVGGSGLELAGLQVEPVVIGSNTAKFDLSFDFTESREEVVGEIEYSADLFDRSSIEILVMRLLRVLSTVAEAPRTRLGAIDVLSPAERGLVLGDRSAGSPPTQNPDLVEVFEAQSRLTPDGVALVAGREWSFAELDAWSNRLARYLLEQGAGAGTVVGLAVPRALMVPAILGVLKCGSAYLPLDVELPAERIAFMMEDARPAVVLSDVEDSVLEGCSADSLAARRSKESPAYIIYTSGSTGRPKGVVVPHRGLANLFASHRAHLMPADGAYSVAHVASFVFDGSWEPVLWMLAGNPLHVLEADVYRDADAVVDYVRRNSIDVIDVTPTYARELIGAGLLEAGLRVLLVGGEATDEALWRRLCAVPGLVVHDLYGPTEATVDAYGWDGSPEGGRTAYRLAGMRVYVLDAGLQPAPAGVTGELYVAGAGLALGYLNRPALTTARFVASPFSGPGERMYRTGDLARFRADGVLEFAGRIDGQVKLRGFRIELGEVESALLALPGVAQAAVVVREDAPGLKRLVGYAVGDLSGARDELARALPEYMVPSALVTVEAIPRTISGKLDVCALPAPDLALRAGAVREAQTPVEQTVARLMAGVLGLPQVGADDDFFALGGDSIVSIQLVSRARAAGLSITPRDVFRHKTVAGLALAAERVAAADPAEPAAVGWGRVPLTPIQRWLVELGGPIDGYHQSMTVRTPAGATHAQITAVLQGLIDHHDLLRARLVDGELVVPPPGSVRATTTPTRLAPTEGRMIDTDWGDDKLTLRLHHLVVDGVSWRILLADLAQAWAAVEQGRPVRLEPVPTSFRRWALGLTDLAPHLTGQLGYWEDQLGSVNDQVTGGFGEPAGTVATTGEITLELPPARTEPLLTTVPAAFHAGVDDVLLTALALTMAGDDGLLVAVEAHGREQELVAGADLARTVGWFTSEYPVRLDPGPIDRDDARRGGPAAGPALKAIKEQLRSVPDRGVGYGLLRYLNDDTAARLAKLGEPRIGFNYLGRLTIDDGADGDWEPLDWGGGADDAMPAQYQVEVNAVTEDRPDGPHLVATWSWPDGQLTEAQVRATGERWFASLDGLTAHAGDSGAGGRTPSDLDLVSLSQADIDELEADFDE